MKYLAVPLLALALLSSCGDDDSGKKAEAETKTGRFVDGPVAGLRFTTATHSGLTDADGTFTYVVGETVTFAVGGVTLGSALGADVISPLDLFGATLPASADAYRIAFETFSPIDGLVRAVTFPGTQLGINEPAASINGFTKALNVVMFLMALDVDGDASNGIDLTGRDSALANAALSFDATNHQFAVESLAMFAARFGGVAVTGGLSTLETTGVSPVELAIAHIYASLGVDASGGAVSSMTEEGASSPQASVTFDARGLVASYVDDDTYDIVRDSVGRITRLSNTEESAPFAAYSYSASGQLTQITGDGVTYALTYDDAGRLLSRTQTRDDESATLTFSYDAATSTLTRTSPALCASRTDTFDAQGRTTQVRVANYSGGCESGSSTPTITVTYTYAEDGLLATSRTSIAVGASALVYDRAISRDAAGHAVSETTTLMQDTTVQGTITMTRTFEGDRQLTQVARAVIEGAPQDFLSTQRTYNANGQLASLSASLSGSSQTQTFTYDADGVLASTSTASGTDAPSVVTYGRTQVANVLAASYGFQSTVNLGLGPQLTNPL